MAGLSWLPGFPPLSRVQQQQQQKLTANPSPWTDTATRASSNTLATPPPTTDAIPRSPSATANPKPKSPASVPEHSPLRPKAVHRMSSFLGLGRSSSASPPPEMGRSSGTIGGGGYRARQLDWEQVGEEEERREERAPERLDTWYNPNLMQMMETVQTVMMTRKDITTGLPAVYNSYILCMIEGIGKMTRHLRKKEEELEELKGLREKELEEFRGISEDWIKREKDYKAEIKRLELIMARESSEGVASVALARHGSLVNRSDSKRFQAQVKRLSDSRDQAGGFASDFEREGNEFGPNETTRHPRSVDTIWQGPISNSDELLSREVAKKEKKTSRFLQDQGKVPNPQARLRGSASSQRSFATENPDQKSTDKPLVPKVAIRAALQPGRLHRDFSGAFESRQGPLADQLESSSSGDGGVQDGRTLPVDSVDNFQRSFGEGSSVILSAGLQTIQLPISPEILVGSSTKTKQKQTVFLSRASHQGDGDAGDDESLEASTPVRTATQISSPKPSPASSDVSTAKTGLGVSNQQSSARVAGSTLIGMMETTAIRPQRPNMLPTAGPDQEPSLTAATPIASSTSSGSVIWLGSQEGRLTQDPTAGSLLSRKQSPNGLDEGKGAALCAVSKSDCQGISISQLESTADECGAALV
ncbi:hypothetical protein B0T14DRAFT_566197 [Immersiella caudata]|uniref:Uncharacterized protein n=1 Tax=Immersiella caudata TaxID=314043 RepID=A0AA39WPR5_9PEZI|nr:hypothetical protein B0T14DRAFT_566197 [Immersiella caudata]